MTSAKKKQQNHENVPFSQGETMWKAQQAKEKSGAARKRGAPNCFTEPPEPSGEARFQRKCGKSEHLEK